MNCLQFCLYCFQLNKCLLENQKLWQEKLKKTEDKLKDVEATRQQVLYHTILRIYLPLAINLYLSFEI